MDTDTPQGIIGKFDFPLLAVNGPGMPALLRATREIPQVLSCYAFGNEHHVTMKDKGLSPDAAALIIRTALYAKGYGEVSIKAIEPNIEDCFMYFDTMEEKA